MTVQRQNDFPGWRMVCEYWREIESFSCRICAYHIVCYMCNDPIVSFHRRFATSTTSRDVACFIHNKEYAFESGPNDRKQNGGACFSSDGWWGELSQVLWWCAILCIFRVVLMLKPIKCSNIIKWPSHESDHPISIRKLLLIMKSTFYHIYITLCWKGYRRNISADLLRSRSEKNPLIKDTQNCISKRLDLQSYHPQCNCRYRLLNYGYQWFNDGYVG